MKRFIFKMKKSVYGNITIMVLIIGLVIIFAITALTKFMFEDIIFTRLDVSKLKALNIAEAGISNMFSNIEKFHNDEISSLPSSPYTEEVLNSDNEVIGSFTVEYDDIYNDEGKLTNYIITSEGTDSASGQSRKVRVNLAVSFSTEVDIFEYIYSEGSLEFFDLVLTAFIHGPLYVGGDLVMRDFVSFGDVVSGDKVLVGGNLDMGGYTRLRSEMINVGKDIEMSAGLLTAPYIESSSSETLTMIVMNDIRMKNSSRIGSSGNPVDLSCHGDISISGGAHIHYIDPIGDDIFAPPKLNVMVYVNSFINQIQEPPSDVLIIDEDDMLEEGVFAIDPALIDKPPPDDVFFRQNGDNSIMFYEDNGSYFLEVEGNVLVDGDIRIGKYIEDNNIDPPDNDIYYSGKGKLIATGNIDASCGLVPTNPISGFPESKLLILMPSGNLDITIEDYNNNIGNYNDPDVYILGVVGGTATLNAHNALLGSLISEQIDAKDSSGWIGQLLGSLANIGYEEDLGKSIPEDLPKLVYGGATFSKQWEEVVD